MGQIFSVFKIVEQRSLVSVKAIFRKYECKNFLSSGREAERQLQLIMLKVLGGVPQILSVFLIDLKYSLV